MPQFKIRIKEEENKEEVFDEMGRLLILFNDAFLRWDEETMMAKRQNLKAQLRSRQQEVGLFLDGRVKVLKQKIYKP